MEWGPHEKELQKLADEGVAVAAIERRPTLFDYLHDVWLCFTDLHNRTRPVGFGAAGIPFNQIESWLNLHGIYDIDMREWYFELISVLDQMWLDHQESKQKK